MHTDTTRARPTVMDACKHRYQRLSQTASQGYGFASHFHAAWVLHVLAVLINFERGSLSETRQGLFRVSCVFFFKSGVDVYQCKFIRSHRSAVCYDTECTTATFIFMFLLLSQILCESNICGQP